MRQLSVAEVVELHRRIIGATGGSQGVRDFGALEAAVAQPQMSFGGEDLYATPAEKAAALCFSMVQNHPFLDGNKRIGHAAMETFLVLNGLEIDAATDDQEAIILSLASGTLTRAALVEWLGSKLVPRTGE